MVVNMSFLFEAIFLNNLCSIFCIDFRYLAIVHAMHYTSWVTVKRISWLLGCLWCLAVATFIGPLPTKSSFIYYQFSSSELMCGLFWEYPWFCLVTAVYIPLLSGETVYIPLLSGELTVWDHFVAICFSLSFFCVFQITKHVIMHQANKQ